MSAQDQGLPEIKLEADAMYREDVYTDRRAGTIRVMTPVTAAGAPDPSRPTLYAGQTQLMTPGGVLPLMFEIEASDLAQAIAKFPDAVEQATGIRPALPPHMADLYDRTERFTVLPNEQAAVERFIRERGRAAGDAAA